MTLIRLYEFLKNSRAPCDACQSININQHQNRLIQAALVLNETQEVVVEDDGIEPTTPCLQSRCSPS
jgi:hypothetical protein